VSVLGRDVPEAEYCLHSNVLVCWHTTSYFRRQSQCAFLCQVLLALILSTSQNLDLPANICTPHFIIQLHRRGRTGLTANRHNHDDGNNNRPRGRPLLLMFSYVLSFCPTCLKYRALKHSTTALSPSSCVSAVMRCGIITHFKTRCLGSQEQTNLSGP
jgi:hypothetical protein